MTINAATVSPVLGEPRLEAVVLNRDYAIDDTTAITHHRLVLRNNCEFQIGPPHPNNPAEVDVNGYVIYDLPRGELIEWLHAALTMLTGT